MKNNVDPAQWARWIQLQKKTAERPLSLKESLAARLSLLERLKKMIQEQPEEWLEALEKDLGKSASEGYTSELMVTLNEIDYLMKHLKSWMTPTKQWLKSLAAPASVSMDRKPFGSVLILSPWNYPLQLSLVPLAGAFAAGNSCVLKPSEFAPNVARLLREKISAYFPLSEAIVVEGEAEVSKRLVEQNWDFIFFTGSPETGKKVAASAAARLIPTALELGGKNPCIVDETGCSEEAVRKIIWGKFLNAGQTCVAPDTVYVHESVYERFLLKASKVLDEFYGNEPEKSADYGRMIHEAHWERVMTFMDNGLIRHGGYGNREERFIAPTLMTDVKEASPIAKEEIFGPILVVEPYSQVEDLPLKLGDAPSPLASYVFSKDATVVEFLSRTLKSGAFAHNQVIFQAARPEIPFGGVGNSGYGRYHGKASFELFTYVRPFYTDYTLKGMTAAYPPYRKGEWKLLDKARKLLF